MKPENAWIDFAYVIASVLFILGLKMMTAQKSAQRGNLLSAVGMLIAIVATLAQKGLSYEWILVGLAVGSLIGAWMAYTVKMTGMPEMVGMLNGFGGLASLLVGWAEFLARPGGDLLTLVSTYLAVLIGGVTFSGSLVAWAKLSERVSSKAFLFRGQQVFNGVLVTVIVGCGVVFCVNPELAYPMLMLAIGLSLLLGIMAVIPIGGADMPVVISLLNSYSGMAGCAAGFVILNSVLIVTGGLVGASGIILTAIMCKAMNRSLANVLFSGFGAAPTAGGTAVKGEAKPLSPQEAYLVLEAARNVMFVPGYGLAVAQAQHAVRELANLLEANGAEVSYAIHAVAGRMPGHMNVLLAEADVPFEQLIEMDTANARMAMVDVAIVIGANDVVNPAAREDTTSPLYGMPIINVDQARTVFVLKRSMASGFSGVDNPLFFFDNARMIFGDAKATIQAISAEFKAV
ncbi:MAG: NAD(P)(+) transhydrogenase (Re/Si-specific) subunit beta [Bryobacterales bacterium]|nr:NAD(P)(+) transhydrogenase (Re/Si-specific) subunit beta [Bryobacterales bacterium]